MKILPISIVSALVVIGLAVWLLLPGSRSEQLPVSKNMADIIVHLMEMERFLEQKSEQIEEPQLCNCCNATLVGGQCPNCLGNCDQTIEYKKPDYHDIPCDHDDRRPDGEENGGRPDYDGGDEDRA